MEMVETRILTDDWDVDHRLVELALDKGRLLHVVEVALSASADSTPYHPANAAGTLAYQYGTWALRDQFVGNGWVIDRSDAVEAIRNDETMVKVVYSNVDVAGDLENGPKPRSRKGAGSERVCNGFLFDDLPQYAPAPDDEYATYFLMVDVNGAAELTRPVIQRGTFSSYIERIMLTDGGEPFDGESLLTDGGDVADDFDPQVIRK